MRWHDMTWGSWWPRWLHFWLWNQSFVTGKIQHLQEMCAAVRWNCNSLMGRPLWMQGLHRRHLTVLFMMWRSHGAGCSHLSCEGCLWPASASRYMVWVASFVWHYCWGSYRKEKAEDSELLLVSSLPSSPAVFLWLFVMPLLRHLLPGATALPGAYRYCWGGSACEVDHNVCQHLREKGWIPVANLERQNEIVQPWYAVPVKS